MPDKTGRYPVEIVAKVQSMELDMNHDGSYKLLLEDGSTVRADFTGSQWDILESRHRRGEFPLKIVGEGDFTDGRLKRIVSIDLKKTERVWPPEDPEEPTLLHLIKEIHKKYPQDDWDDIPTDAAKNLHHYLLRSSEGGRLMRPVFADACYWIALLLERDQWHDTALPAVL